MLRELADRLQRSTGTAFVINDIKYSYSDLKRLTAVYQNGILSDYEPDLIGIMMHNDIETYAMLVAAILSETGYVVLNPNTPAERNQLICKEANLSCVCSSLETDRNLIPDGVRFVDLLSVETEDTKLHYQDPDPLSTAYVLFTSGSTGKPKGVRITKGNLNALMGAFFKIPIEISEDDQVLQMFDLTFDGSVLMLFLPLSKGAAVYTTDPGRIKYMDIGRILSSYQMSYVFLVPSVISLLKPFLPEFRFPSVKTFIVGAEATTMSLLELIRPSIPNAAIWNLYGPTESTVCCLAYKVDGNLSNELYNDMIPIGKPLPGFHLLIMNEGKAVDQVGAKGELFIAGDQLTPGYINDMEKNKLSFCTLDYCGKPERFYATGDIVYLNAFGNIMYCGRKDHQVKIQGYRIELNEIEYHARNYTKTEAVAVAKEVDGNNRLYLFVEGFEGSEKDLLVYLETKLPDYMVPRIIVKLKQLPLNASNKIDRKLLADSIQLGI